MVKKVYINDPEAPEPNTIVTAISAAIFDFNGRILLQQRPDNELWELPGGKLDPGETISEGVVREVREETCLNVTVERLIGVYSDPNVIMDHGQNKLTQLVAMLFKCNVEKGSMCISSENLKIDFFTLDEAEKLPLCPGHLQRIKDSFTNSVEAFIR